MYKSIVKNVFMYCTAATALFCVMQSSAALPPAPSGWVNTGADGLGGFNFTGSGNVGALSSVTNPFLSAGGGDHITLNVGGYAVGTSTDTIIITTSNNTLLNFGTIAGLSGVGTQVAGLNAISINTATMSNDMLFNHGVIAGGAGSSGSGHGGDGGDAVRANVTTIVNSSLQNFGSLAGGNGGNGAVGSPSGRGGYGLKISANTINNSSILFNAVGASVTGGNGGSATGSHNNGATGGDGVHVTLTTASGDTVTNEGTITGGNGGNGGATGNGGNAGDGIFFDPAGPSAPNSFINTGTIKGGNGGTGGSVGNGGTGVFVIASGGTLINLGTISAGKGPNADAINLSGANNKIILGGHSTVNGLIHASGPANSNQLVLKFTGVSPAAQAALVAQLKGLGVLNGVDSSATFNFRGATIAYDPLVVVLSLSSYQLQALTPNQAAVGANLDSFPVNPSGDMLNVLNALDASGNVPAGLEALSPQRYQIFGDIALADANFLALNVDERLNNLRDGSESIDTSAVGGDTAFNGGGESIAGWTKNDGKDAKDHKTELEPPKEKRWGFFASGDVVLENFDGDKDLSSSKFTSSGLVLGLDGRINEDWVVGALFDYQYTSATMDNLGSKANVASYGGGLYSGYHNGGYFANGLAAFSRNDYDTSRAVIIPTVGGIVPGIARFAGANTHGNQFDLNVDGGYDFNVCPNVTAGPIAGLQYVHLGVDDFSELGAGAADLAVSNADVNSLRSRLGGRIEYRKQIAKEVAFAAETRAEWQHEFLNDSRAISADFIGSGLGGFAVQTTAPQRDAAVLGAGLNVTVRNRMTIFTDYDVQVGQSSWFEQSIRAGLKFSF